MKRSIGSLSGSKWFVFPAVLVAVSSFFARNASADMPKNGLSIEALAVHEGPFDMPKNGLPVEALSGPFDMPKNGMAPESILAEELMKYIVSCALAPSDRVTAPGSDPGAAVTWQGEIGLCKNAPFGDWASGAPSDACLDMVQACLLARANPLRLSVPVSLRGPNDALAPRSEIPLEMQYREQGGTPIASFDECADPARAASDGTARNCGWSRRYAGRCIANEEVTLALDSGTEAPAGATSEPDVMVRVCEGIYGCDDPAGENPTAGGPRRYSRLHTTARLGPKDTVTFTCPQNGPPTQDGFSSQPARYGYFGIMLAPVDPDHAVPAGMDVGSALENATYPAHEYEVFTVREGAFYGSFPGAPGAHPGDQYACYDDRWDSHMAEVTGRHCMGEGSSCFANAPKPCLPEGEPGSEPGACEGEAAPELGGYYLACRGTPGTAAFRYPITVYVNYAGG